MGYELYFFRPMAHSALYSNDDMCVCRITQIKLSFFNFIQKWQFYFGDPVVYIGTYTIPIIFWNANENIIQDVLHDYSQIV